MPPVHSNTKEAYAGLTPKPADKDLLHIIQNVPVTNWREILKNDFEGTIFTKYPVVKSIKELLYKKGALYASMSGSGSSVYGIFANKPEIGIPDDCRYFLQLPDKKIL